MRSGDDRRIGSRERGDSGRRPRDGALEHMTSPLDVELGSRRTSNRIPETRNVQQHCCRVELFQPSSEEAWMGDGPRTCGAQPDDDDAERTMKRLSMLEGKTNFVRPTPATEISVLVPGFITVSVKEQEEQGHSGWSYQRGHGNGSSNLRE